MKNLLSIFAEQNFSCKLIYLVSHYFLSKKALEGARPWNRAPISHARHSTGQHPKWCVSVCSPSPRLLLEYPLSHKTAVKSVITHQLVAGDGRYAHPLWQEHVFWKFLTDMDQSKKNVEVCGLTADTLSSCAVFSIKHFKPIQYCSTSWTKSFIEAWKEFYYSVFSGNHKFAINRGKARQNQSYGRSPFPLSENPEAVWRIRLFLEDQLLCLKRPVERVIKGL